MLIRHEHPGTGFPQRNDALYARNNSFFYTDLMTYISRKNYKYDWTIMIPTIVGRESRLYILLESIEERRKRICPSLKIEIRLSFDNREKKIGAKRQELLMSVKGKYMSFVDDDDLLTDAYFEDALATIQGNYDVCRLRGQMNQYTFTHSLENTLDKPMCEGDVFLRPPNHLNVMLSEIGKLFRFGNAVRGEDLDWTIRLAQSGSLRREYTSDSSRIHYIYNLGGRTIYPETGFVFDVKILSDLIKLHVENAFDHKNLNLDVEDFQDLNPTAENIAVVIWNKLRVHLKSELDLEVVLYETPRNFVTYKGE
jgi:hypothetical protein